MRLVMNDRLDSELVEVMKDDIDYYVEAHDEEDYMQAYDEEMFYDDLRLDELGVVDVDRVTHAATETKRSKSDDASANSGSLKEKPKSKKSTSHGMVPINIGRARVSSGGKGGSVGEKEVVTPTKKGVERSISLGPAPTVPTARVVVGGGGTPGASMAAILKREGEQQEKERLKQQQLLQQQQQQVRIIYMYRRVLLSLNSCVCSCNVCVYSVLYPSSCVQHTTLF